MATRLIKTSLSHRGYSLVKMSYPLFGLVFIDMFSTSTWFESDIQWLGIPTIVAILVSAHVFLLFLQTDRAARLYYLIHRGKPPAVYLNWLEISDDEAPTIKFGLRGLNLSCVDELHLTMWGNLIFKSRSVCGSLVKNGVEEIEADDVFKVPFGVVSSKEQKEFIELVQRVRPDVVLGKRLQKRMIAKHVKGEDYIQSLGAVFLLFVLFDLSFSLFGYLEMLKQYHLAQVVARGSLSSTTEVKTSADDHFKKAETMLESPPGISLVKRTVLHKGYSTGAVYQSRGEALWYMGRRDEAIKSLQTALEYYPKSLRMHLELARWLAIEGRLREARKVLFDLADEHEDSLLPRLYTIVLFRRGDDEKKAKRYYDIYADKLDLEVFGEEPWWPPGGNRYLNDSWSRDDVHFLLDELLKSK